MINEEKKRKLVEMLTSKLLTPVVYFLDGEDMVQFICFCDGSVTYKEIFITESVLMTLTDTRVRIIDIREFDEFERFELLQQAEMVYCIDPMIQQLFEVSMMDDFKTVLTQKQQLLDRMKDCGNIFLS